MRNRNFGGNEILHVADAVARDKGISKDSIIEALEDAIAMAAKRKYGANINVKATINRNLGNIELYREILVVKDNFKGVNDISSEIVKTIELSEARKDNPDLNEGDIIKEILPPLEIGRLNAISAKQVIISKVKELERDKIFEEYKDRIGEIINGIVEKIEANGYIIKLGNVEAILKKDQVLKTDYYKLGDRIRAYLTKLDKETNGPPLILSRTHKDFVAQLFKQEVPEIYDRIIEIKNIARDPGSRTKISVYSSDSSIDPIGSCVGMRGIRVQSIIKELKGEKIDIVKWSEDPATYVVNALGSIRVSKVVIDEDQNRIEVVVPEEDQSQAIGRRGQNVKLISELVGWRINITTEELESSKRQEEFGRITKLFMEVLNLEEILAQLLASEGFSSIENLADADMIAIASVEGLDEEIAKELISRAKEHLSNNQEIEQNVDKKDGNQKE
jgi:N utilization substance protein A